MSGGTGGGLTAEHRDELRSRAERDPFDEFGGETVEALLDALDDADARLAAVEALHVSSGDGTGGDAGPFCLSDGFSWPCATHAALHPDPSGGRPASPSCSQRSCGQQPTEGAR